MSSERLSVVLVRLLGDSVVDRQHSVFGSPLDVAGLIPSPALAIPSEPPFPRRDIADIGTVSKNEAARIADVIESLRIRNSGVAPNAPCDRADFPLGKGRHAARRVLLEEGGRYRRLRHPATTHRPGHGGEDCAA